MKAPIISFCYNRYDHLQKSLASLLANPEASETDLIVFSDGARGIIDSSKVDAVRQYLSTISGFKSVKVIQRKANYGCALNIIDGIDQVMKDDRYESAVIMEDDIVVSSTFLSFINKALDFYQSDKMVWSVSGVSPKYLELNTDEELAIWRNSECWGWATWADRWQQFSKNSEEVMSQLTVEKRNQWDHGGLIGYSPQVEMNQDGRANTWAIFWSYLVFKNQGLIVQPTQTMVENIGRDGSGIHADGTVQENGPKRKLSEKKDYSLPVVAKENSKLVQLILSELSCRDTEHKSTPARFEELKRKTGLLKIKREMIRAFKDVCPPFIVRMFGVK